MNSAADYREINRNSWNDKVDAHVESDFYDLEAFRGGKNSLKEIELPLLGDVHGNSILHLQCHFGQDTLSLQRMGARCVGVDLSDKAIEKARELNDELGMDARFVACDLYDAPQHIDEKFDVVFTSYGTIGWLPDLQRWARVISAFLKPGGKLVFVEFHPVVWMFDSDFKNIEYRYFKSEPILEEEEGTYADREADFSTKSVSWNHGLGEVVTALLGAGLSINSFQEYDYSPYDNFKNMIEFEKGKFRLGHPGDKIPIIYSLTASKKK